VEGYETKKSPVRELHWGSDRDRVPLSKVYYTKQGVCCSWAGVRREKKVLHFLLHFGLWNEMAMPEPKK